LILALISGEVTMIHAMRFGLGVLILLGCTPLTTADPATQPSTQPLGAAMVRCVDKKVGVAFDRPAGWENDDTPPPNGTARVSFAEPEPWDGGVRAYVEVWMEGDAPAHVSVDLATPADPDVVASKIFIVAGVSARLTARDEPQDGGQDVKAVRLTVQWAKGSRYYQMAMDFPKSGTDQYLKLADEICRSMQILPGK
jgi:hypothetical protein